MAGCGSSSATTAATTPTPIPTATPTPVPSATVAALAELNKPISSFAISTFVPTSITLYNNPTTVGTTKNASGTTSPVVALASFTTKENVDVLIYGTEDSTGLPNRIVQIATASQDRSKRYNAYFNNAGSLFLLKDKASGVSVRLSPIGSSLGVKLFDQTGTELSSTVLSLVNGQLQVTAGTKAQRQSRQATAPTPTPTPTSTPVNQGGGAGGSGTGVTPTNKARLDAIAQLIKQYLALEQYLSQYQLSVSDTHSLGVDLVGGAIVGGIFGIATAGAASITPIVVAAALVASIGAALIAYSNSLNQSVQNPVSYDSGTTYTTGNYDDSATFSDSGDFSYDDDEDDEDD